MVKNKSNKSLQLIMTAASLVGFLGGWMLLGHAPKPGTVAQPAQVSVSGASLDTPLRPSQLLTSNSLVQLSTQSFGTNRTAGLRLRTGGS